jgi:hypothetical protein
MRMRYYGDSYDIVKQSLLRWLRPLGEWSIHPMPTEPMSPADVAAFESLLSAKVVSTEILTVASDRPAYFSFGSSSGHLFLDPDTGLRIRPTRGNRSPEYPFTNELVRLVHQRPDSLTLVFDQSVGRGSEQLHLEDKIRELRRHGVFGSAYVSHACFVFAGRDRTLVERARAQIITESRLPASRFLPVVE